VREVAVRRYDSLRLIYYGASPIAEQTLRRAMQMFGCGFIQCLADHEQGETDRVNQQRFVLGVNPISRRHIVARAVVRGCKKLTNCLPKVGFLRPPHRVL
jgi:hypothetical protein